MKALLASITVLAGTVAAAVAPSNREELDARMTELRAQYAPFLRSLPTPAPARSRIGLPAEWRFTH